jgi:hypothetical protein
MHELVSPQSVDRMLLFLAVIGPLAGLIIGTMLGAHERCAWPRALAGLLLGGLLTVIYAMWRMYGAITESLGLESVANLVLELVLFAVVGVLVALAAFKITRFLRKQT